MIFSNELKVLDRSTKGPNDEMNKIMSIRNGKNIYIKIEADH